MLPTLVKSDTKLLLRRLQGTAYLGEQGGLQSGYEGLAIPEGFEEAMRLKETAKIINPSPLRDILPSEDAFGGIGLQ